MLIDMTTQEEEAASSLLVWVALLGSTEAETYKTAAGPRSSREMEDTWKEQAWSS